ncbi:MAG: hypothetical protein ACUVV0_03305 [Anaerolineae bacterium]
MILNDSNIFIIDRFFPQDVHYAANKQFINRLPFLDAAISIYSLLEICGLASFNLTAQELAEWFYHFDQVYKITVLFPVGLAEQTAEQFWNDLLDEIYRLFTRKMTFIDAAILSLAESYKVSHLVTWNKKDFEGRTDIMVLTPEEFFE